MATDGNGDNVPPVGGGDLPAPDLRTMEELCQPTWNGQGGPIAPNAIQATNFRLKNDMIQQVQNSCQFHRLQGDDANKHLDKFLHVTQSIKVNVVTDDALRLYLFPHSLTHYAIVWFDHLPRNSINTFEQMAKMFLGKYFPHSMVTKLRNEITNIRQRLDESLFEAWEHYKLLIDRCPNHNMLPVIQIDTFYNGLTLRHRDTINAAVGGTFMKRRPEECYDLIENMTALHNDWDTFAQRTTVGQTQNVYAAGAFNQGVTLISRLDISDSMHLHPNDCTAPTVFSIKLKGTKIYRVWSCAMLLVLEENKTGFIDGSCKRYNTYEVLGRQWDRVNVVVLGGF
nr:reverse transcriptase domain-containing protein [Tanacetum cinerariifolium]